MAAERCFQWPTSDGLSNWCYPRGGMMGDEVDFRHGITILHVSATIVQ